ncbi:MAG: response regulator [Mariniblastus sp.]|nr:response regulator [Mariniblastus sp.]
MLKILIVDDSEIDRLLMEGLLKRSIGFDVYWAENGLQALERLEEWNVDLVVTDLQMPVMDGLELVQRVRQAYPQLPVILTTGVGSEKIASEALNQGAAGYVPKDQLNALLVPTVRNALNTLGNHRNYNHLLDRANVAQFSFVLDNDRLHFAPLVDFCDKIMRGMVRLDRIERLRISLAIEHALHNALYRGNLEIDGKHPIHLDERKTAEEIDFLIQDRLNSLPYKDRKILVGVRLKKNSIAIRIRDQGPGFDPTKAGKWSQSDSRGLILMKSFMDEVVYSDHGNEVFLRRSWKTHSSRGKDGRIVDSGSRTKPSRLLGKLNCDQTGNVVAMTVDKFMLGRRNSCHLVIPFQSVAENHCLLIFDQGSWYAKNMSDLKQGTRINGEPVDYNRIESGDLLSIGAYDYQIEY